MTPGALFISSLFRFGHWGLAGYNKNQVDCSRHERHAYMHGVHLTHILRFSGIFTSQLSISYTIFITNGGDVTNTNVLAQYMQN